MVNIEAKGNYSKDMKASGRDAENLDRSKERLTKANDMASKLTQELGIPMDILL